MGAGLGQMPGKFRLRAKLGADPEPGVGEASVGHASGAYGMASLKWVHEYNDARVALLGPELRTVARDLGPSTGKAMRASGGQSVRHVLLGHRVICMGSRRVCRVDRAQE